MKEHPILFSAPMVRAILEGRKTQTRRVVKGTASWHKGLSRFGRGGAFMQYDGQNGTVHESFFRCPYGQPGDNLWVREAWRAEALHDNTPPRDVPPAEGCTYEADEHGAIDGKLRPSMFMPRWASRILLEVTSVRVERLNDISANDAEAEGAKVPCDEHGHPLLRLTGRVAPSKFVMKYPQEWTTGDFLRFEYAELWEQINGTGSWAANPWIWAIEFKRVQP